MMYRKLLLPLSESACGQAAMATGFAVARVWQAHLSALIVQVDSRDVAPLAGEGLSGAMIEDMMQAAERDGAGRTARLRALFEAGQAACGDGAAGTATLVLRGRDEDILPAQARLADLTILPHPDRSQDETASDTLHAVLFDSGRPVLISARTPAETIGTRCAVAWNGTVESSSALAAMLPWLRRASAVRVMHAGAYQRRGPPAGDVLPYLKLHGIAADVVEFTPVDRDVGAGLLSAAAEFGADLIGMGAYSHSRLRQLILGGVTRHVLQNSTVPILMAH